MDEQALTDVSSRTWDRSGLMAAAINTVHWWRWNGQKCHLRQCAGHSQLTLPFPSVYCIQSLGNQKYIYLSIKINYCSRSRRIAKSGSREGWYRESLFSSEVPVELLREVLVLETFSL